MRLGAIAPGAITSKRNARVPASAIRPILRAPSQRAFLSRMADADYRDELARAAKKVAAAIPAHARAGSVAQPRAVESRRHRHGLWGRLSCGKAPVRIVARTLRHGQPLSSVQRCRTVAGDSLSLRPFEQP